MFVFVVLFVLLVAAVCAYDLSVRSSRVWRMVMSQFPGEPALPIVGNLPQLGSSALDIQKNLHRLWKKHGMKNFRVVLGTELLLFLNEVEDVKKILGRSVELQKADFQNEIFAEHFGNSIFNSYGNHWRVMRKILTPSFHFQLLEQHLQRANRESAALVQRLQRRAGQPAFDVEEDLDTYAMNLIMSAAMGFEHEKGEDRKTYAAACRRMMPLYIKRFYSLLNKYNCFYNLSALGREGADIKRVMNSAVSSIIKFRKKEFDRNIKPLLEGSDEELERFISRNRAQLTVVDVMLLSRMPDGAPLSDKTLYDETHVVIFGGHDTTIITLGFALCNLGKYKEFQDKAYQEQLEIFGDDLSRDPTLKDLNNMKYLERFIKESLRLYPSVSQFTRRINNDLVLHDGKVIPAGTNVMFYLPGIHKHPDNFPDPDRFDPDRFLFPHKPYSYIPFSAGPKNCIGARFAWMSLRAALSKLLRHFEVHLESAAHEPQPVNQIILDSANGFKIQLTQRNKCKDV